MLSHEQLITTCPLFIVGSPRSGTTVVMRAVVSTTNYFSPSVEGHVMAWLLKGIDEVFSNQHRHTQAFLPTSACAKNNFDVLLSWIGRAIDGFMRQIAGVEDPGKNWIDKTPDIAQLRRVPLIQNIFPRSKIIFLYRHPRDVVLSTRKVWNPHTSDKELLTRWRDFHREYRTQIRPRLDMDRVIEIPQELIVTDPYLVGKQIGVFLEQPEDVQQALAIFFQNKRINRRPEVRNKGFTYLQQAEPRFLRKVETICGQEMRIWGYTSSRQDFSLPKEPQEAAKKNGQHCNNQSSALSSTHLLTSITFPPSGQGQTSQRCECGPGAGTIVKPSEVLLSYREVSKLYPHSPSLSLWRSWEHAAFRRHSLTEPVLDVGCGDGRFFSLLWHSIKDVTGIDASSSAVKAARASGNYRSVIQADAGWLPLHSASFASVFANCSLEHMKHLKEVLLNIHRVLVDNGLFLFSVVTDRFLAWNTISHFVYLATNSEEAAGRVRNNYAAYHSLLNALSISEWTDILKTTGFAVQHYTRIVPEFTGRLFALIDHLWHLRSGTKELGSTLQNYLRGVPHFPQEFGNIIESILNMEIDYSECAGLVFVALKK